MLWAMLPLLLVLALLTPPLRPMFSWFLTVSVAPVLLLTKIRFPPAPLAQPMAEPDVPPDVRGVLSRLVQPLTPQGFTPVGWWRFDKFDGLSTMHLLLLADPSQTVAIATCQSMHGASKQTGLEFRTRARSGGIRTVSALIDRESNGDDRLVSLPRLGSSSRLHTAHAALVSEGGGPDPTGFPQDPAAWSEFLDRGREDGLLSEQRRHVLTRPNRHGVRRFTFPGAVVASLGHIWPLKARARRLVHDRERATLARLGLARLLEEAERDPATQAVERAAAAPAGTVTIPDDRGMPRAVSKRAAAERDDRWGDPRFRAALEQSEAARVGQFRRTNWLGLVGAAAVIAGMVAGVPVWASAAIVLGLLLMSGAALNFGRVAGSERAAADALLRRGLCPSCLYGLGGLPAGEDGCLVCPECGGAWRADRASGVIAFERRPGGAGLGTAVGGVAASGTRGRSHARDHRGAVRALVPPRLEAEVVLASPGPYLDRLAAARAEIARSGRLIRWTVAPLVFLLFVALPLVPLAVMLVRGRGLPGLPGLLLVLFAAYGLVMAWGVLRGNFAYRSSRIIRAMLARSLCPSCAEDLAGRPPAQDGLTECACGAAWRVPGAPTPAAPPTVVIAGPGGPAPPTSRHPPTERPAATTGAR